MNTAFHKGMQGAFLLFLLAATNLAAAILHVPKDYSSIQQALQIARVGDIIQVAPGEYTERIVLGAGVTLEGAGPQKTILRGLQYASEPIVIVGEGSTLEGFTLTGVQPGARAAVVVLEATAYIRHNLFIDNQEPAIFIKGRRSAPIIEKNRITRCWRSGISVSEAAPIIRDNQIYSNPGAGIILLDSLGLIENNRITSNQEAGISVMQLAPSTQRIRFGRQQPLTLSRPQPPHPSSLHQNQKGEEPPRLIIRHNIIKHNLDSGIICDSTSPLIIGNDIFSPGKPAIRLFASDAIIKQNQLLSTGPPAITINLGGAPTIVENKISGVLRFGILGANSRTVVKDNDIQIHRLSGGPGEQPSGDSNPAPEPENDAPYTPPASTQPGRK